MTIFDINKAITDCFDDLGEVLDFDRLSQLIMDKDEKIENLACWSIDLDAEAKAIKAQIDIMKKRLESTERKAKSVKDFLSMVLDGEKFKSAKCTVSYRKSVAVDITDSSEIPDCYMSVKQTVEPNKTAIKEAIKAGEVIPGCALVEHQSIQIK